MRTMPAAASTDPPEITDAPVHDIDDDSLPPPGQAEFLPLGQAAQHAHLVRPNTLAARWSIGVIVLLACVCAATLLHPAAALADPARIALTSGLVGLGLLGAACLFVPPAASGTAVTAVLVLASLLLTASAAALGWRLSAPGVGLFGVFAAAACLAASVRSGLLVAAVGMACVLVLQYAPQALPWAAASAVSGSSTMHLFVQLLNVATGLACGIGFTRVVTHHMGAADERERRFTGLLGIAVDAYWEVDAQFRLVAVTSPRDPRVAATMSETLGKVPWETPQFGCDADVLDELLADLETRVGFRDLPLQWQSRSGTMRHFSISGEPRFDAGGLFRGYWGVAREVTAHVQARQALLATETRYQELFSRIPTPLVLHRQGIVIDANPAALQLFAYDELKSMLGRDVLENHESGDSRERGRRRLEQLEAMTVGEALSVTDFRLRSRAGRRMAVRAADVRVHADGGPATLSIFVDDTERRRAEEAVRRSEAMLSHLVATSPDVITLTDLATGRYAMVNHTFEQLTGYTSNEVVGRTSVELGIWSDTEQRENFINLVRERGTARDVRCDFVTKSKQVVQLLVSGAVFAMDRRTYLVINGRDISAQERSRLERDAILENASIGIAVTREQRFVLANPRMEEMFGWPQGGLTGQPGSAVWRDEADYAEIGALVGPRLAKGELVEIERTTRRRDGSTFIARVLGKAIDPSRATKGGTIWIIEDITERRQVGEALARARDQAEAANRAKSAFLANTSHELRTPLNGMLGLAQLAREPDIDSARRQQYLDQIAENAQALAAIISDVLDLSKIEAGKLVLESTSFDLPELLTMLKRAYGTLAAGRALELQIEIDNSVQGHVSGDPLRVRQVLSNYLTNALKFTEHGTVRLVARRDAGDVVRFEVHDSGPGIDEATQARLFRPFTQADESTTRRFGGTGLGLSICRELALLMGGEVGVISQAGAGACFWAELVLPPVAAPVAEAAEPSAHDLRGMRVLVVEDNPVNMLIGVAMLERWGVAVEQADDGRQALIAVERAFHAGEPFDAVLMDVQMPVMSGYEATRELRRIEPGRKLPIIALTAAALVSEREQALRAGMDDFLTKPIDAERLRATLGRWAAGPRAAKAQREIA